MLWAHAAALTSIKSPRDGRRDWRRQDGPVLSASRLVCHMAAPLAQLQTQATTCNSCNSCGRPDGSRAPYGSNFFPLFRSLFSCHAPDTTKLVLGTKSYIMKRNNSTWVI